MKLARFDHKATLLRNGKVLVIGGSGTNQPGSAELYDPALGTWSLTGSLRTNRVGFTATLLTNGQVLVAGSGSFGVTNTELYDPATGIWKTTGSLNEARQGHTATLLPNGKVLVAGGYKRLRQLQHPQRGIIRSRHRRVDSHRTSDHGKARPHGDAASGRNSFGGGRLDRPP